MTGAVQVIDEKDDDATGETVVVDEKGRKVEEERQEKTRPSDRAEDQRVDVEEEDDEGDEQEERVAADPGTTRSVNAAKRARRREAMERDRATIGLLKQELDETRSRLGELEKRGVRNEFERIDSAIDRAKATAARAKEAIREAVEKGDGMAAADAQEALADAKLALQNFQRMRANGEDAIRRARESGSARATKPSPEHEALARQAVDYGENWKTRNTWWGEPGNEVDTAVVDALDNYVMEVERLDPATAEYWQRLDELIAERLPHRGQDGGGRRDDTRRGDPRQPQARQQPRSKPPSRRSDPSDDAGGEGGFQVSAAQKAAAMEAGLWDDPKDRKRAIAYFRKAEREARDRGDR